MERVLRFLASRRSLVGFAAAGTGLALYLLGVLNPIGPLWLTLVVALYFVGLLVVPKERGPEVRPNPAADTAAIRDALDELLHQVRFKVAPDILARVESIRKSILSTLEALTDRDASDPTVYLIRQTALDYLPTALSAYLALPRLYAERRRVQGGRTPHDVLLEQLDLMDSRLHEIAEAMLVHDSERVLENGRFLADRFGRSALRLPESGAGTPAPAPPEVPATVEVPAQVEVPAAVPAAEPATTTSSTQAASEREQVH
jgi:hypothetical protein